MFKPRPFSLCICIALLTSACVSDDLQNTAQLLLGGANSSTEINQSGLNNSQIALGLKEALNVGTNNVVAQLGKSGGFNLDPKIRIPLPDSLARVDSGLKAIGMGYLTEDLQTRMNDAAELATNEAKVLFIDAIKQMTIADARQILSGQQDAATQYLRKTMGNELALRMQPIVGNTLAQTGAIKAYDAVVGQYAAMPLLANVKTDMNLYVANKTVDGIFYYVAQEEAAIRTNPAKRTTELLKTVFDGQ